MRPGGAGLLGAAFGVLLLAAPGAGGPRAVGEGLAGNGGGAAAEGDRFTLDELGRMAAEGGLKGSMHGVAAGQSFVFTWHHPRSFFRNVNFSLVPGNPEIARALAALERHQEVLVKGRLVETGTSQPHLRVEAVEPGRKWDPGIVARRPSTLLLDLRKAVAGVDRIHAMVHAVGEDARMLAIEFRDEVVPVRVPDDAAVREAVRGLYRGDRVRLRVLLEGHPVQPLHLSIDPDQDDGREPVAVTDRIHAQHGRERTLEGRLVLFPKSPAIRRDIYAVEEAGPEGLHRYFTIFNFRDMADQARIDALLRPAWEQAKGEILDGRNKFIHSGARVRVTGEVSNPARNQANPTLMTDSTRVRVLLPPSTRATGSGTP